MQAGSPCPRCGQILPLAELRVGRLECRYHPGQFDLSTARYTCCGLCIDSSRFCREPCLYPDLPYLDYVGCTALDHDIQHPETDALFALVRGWTQTARYVLPQAVTTWDEAYPGRTLDEKNANELAVAKGLWLSAVGDKGFWEYGLAQAPTPLWFTYAVRTVQAIAGDVITPGADLVHRLLSVDDDLPNLVKLVEHDWSLPRSESHVHRLSDLGELPPHALVRRVAPGKDEDMLRRLTNLVRMYPRIGTYLPSF